MKGTEIASRLDHIEDDSKWADLYYRYQARIIEKEAQKALAFKVTLTFEDIEQLLDCIQPFFDQLSGRADLSEDPVKAAFLREVRDLSQPVFGEDDESESGLCLSPSERLDAYLALIGAGQEDIYDFITRRNLARFSRYLVYRHYFEEDEAEALIWSFCSSLHA